MRNIFVICAGNKAARSNFIKSVLSPVSREQVVTALDQGTLINLESTNQAVRGFYIWGFRDVPKLAHLWENITPGDYVLGFYDFHYQTVSKALARISSPIISATVWGNSTYPNVVFMSEPTVVHVSAKSQIPMLCSTYRGPLQISAQRINQITQVFGTVDEFIQQRILASGIST